MFQDMLTEPCTILRKQDTGEEDEYGDPKQGEDPIDSACYLEQKQREEPSTAGEMSVTEWLAVFEPDVEISTRDSILIGDYAYEVVGDPWPAKNPRTLEVHHLEVTLRRTSGKEQGS